MASSARKKKTTRGKAAGTRGPAAARAINGRAGGRKTVHSASGGLNGKAAPAPEVHCALAPMEGMSMLLPTKVVAEVIDYVDPEPVNDTPDWFLGQIEWENRPVPVFSYAALISGDQPSGVTDRTRIVILKSLADSARVPYLGIVIRDIPRLLNVQPPELVHTGDERKSLGVFCHVTVCEEPAVIPDLERLTHLVTHAAYGALPITQISS